MAYNVTAAHCIIMDNLKFPLSKLYDGKHIRKLTNEESEDKSRYGFSYITNTPEPYKVDVNGNVSIEILGDERFNGVIEEYRITLKDSRLKVGTNKT